MVYIGPLHHDGRINLLHPHHSTGECSTKDYVTVSGKGLSKYQMDFFSFNLMIFNDAENIFLLHQEQQLNSI